MIAHTGPVWAEPTADADARLQAEVDAWRKANPALVNAWREASDPFPDPGTPPNYRATPQLRWLESTRGRSLTLQQLWVTDDGMGEAWRPVPTVKGAR